MSALPEISVAVPQPRSEEAPATGATLGPWGPAELPRSRRPSPTTLVVLALLAGVGALALGLLAGVSSLRGEGGDTAKATAERQVLALLAKPSTERIAFRGSGGRLVLAVGSGGRAAISMRGLQPSATGAPYYAWVVGAHGPVKAAAFEGSERAVLLTVPVEPKDVVVVSPTRPSGTVPTASQFVALRR